MKLTEQEKQIAWKAWHNSDVVTEGIYAAVEAVLAHRQPAQPEAQPAPDVIDRQESYDQLCQRNHDLGLEALEWRRKYLVLLDEALCKLTPEEGAPLLVQQHMEVDRILASRRRLAAKHPQQETREQQVTAILQSTVKETNEQWEDAAEKIARVREGK